MKLTNEDLRTIILEETNSVLKEFHDAVDDSDESMVKTKQEEENPKPTTPADFGSSLIDTGKNFKKDPDIRRDAKGPETAVASSLVQDIVSLLPREGSSLSLLNKIKKAVETILKAEN
jgi:hypothetical protein